MREKPGITPIRWAVVGPLALLAWSLILLVCWLLA